MYFSLFHLKSIIPLPYVGGGEGVYGQLVQLKYTYRAAGKFSQRRQTKYQTG